MAAESLQPLRDVTRLSARVVRVLGANPGKYTLQGTNTYLISAPQPGTGSPRRGSTGSGSSSSVASILVDTGEGQPGYVTTLERVLRGSDESAGGRRSLITDIILTHRHGDHVNGLPSVLELLARLRSEDGGAESSSSGADDGATGPPRLHKFPDPATDAALVEKLQALPAGSYTVHNSPAGPSPLHPLAHGDVLAVGGAADGASASSLEVLHSPGHTTDHVSLLLREEHALLTGDNVLGQGTSVFEDLKAYIASLRLMKDALVASGVSPHLKEENRLYPAHGPHMDNGRVTLERYVEHRLAREAQLLELLRKAPPEDEESWTIRSLVATLYAGYPEGLYLPAARGIWLHLQKLAHDGAEGAAHMRGQRLSCTNDAELDDIKLEGESRWLLAMDQKWRLSEAVKM